MTTIHHLNAGWLQVPPNPRASCHCLLLEDRAGLALVDTGIGLQDIANPSARIGDSAIQQAGFQFHEHLTLRRQLQSRNLNPDSVSHILLTHLDPDHAGGLADFPHAQIHLSSEELAAATTPPASPDPRYRPQQWSHHPHWHPHPSPTANTTPDLWFNLPARRVDLGFSSRIYLIPLFGHTLGHCGIAIEQPHGWLLHTGDAYYLRGELSNPHHPLAPLSTAMSAHNPQRLASLHTLRHLSQSHPQEITLLNYHDESDLPL